MARVMREIDVSKIKDAVSELCLKANFELRGDVLAAIKSALKQETNARARDILKSIIENAKIARKKRMEKNAPSTLSKMKANRVHEGDNRLICCIWGGSTNSLVPERKRVALKRRALKKPPSTKRLRPRVKIAMR